MSLTALFLATKLLLLLCLLSGMCCSCQRSGGGSQGCAMRVPPQPCSTARGQWKSGGEEGVLNSAFCESRKVDALFSAFKEAPFN